MHRNSANVITYSSLSNKNTSQFFPYGNDQKGFVFLIYTPSMWYLYILLCEDNSLYTGISPDPEKRFEVHKQGKGSKYTASHRPLKIVYKELLPTKSAALKREYEIKQWTREEKINKLKLPFVTVDLH